MKVRMISSLDGLRGRGPATIRGLSQIPAAQANEALEVFQAAASRPLQDAHLRFVRASAAEALPIDITIELERLYRHLQDRIGSHEEALSNVDTMAQLAAWSTIAGNLADESAALVAKMDQAVGAESLVRPLKLGLWTLGAITLFGGAAYLVVKYGSKKGR